jgi:hypothetical protein
MASCATLNAESALEGAGIIAGWDCINGSVIPEEMIGSKINKGVNYTELITVFEKQGGTKFECKIIRIQNLEFRVQSSEFRVQSSEFRVQSSEFRVQRSELRDQS